MNMSTVKNWETKRTDETIRIENLLGEHFDQVDAYRYNSASIRLRVIDMKFEGLSRTKRDTRVERWIEKLPPETQRDIVTLFTFAPSELTDPRFHLRELMQNTEFEAPSPSTL